MIPDFKALEQQILAEEAARDLAAERRWALMDQLDDIHRDVAGDLPTRPSNPWFEVEEVVEDEIPF